MNLGEVTMSPKFTVAKLTHSRQNMQVSSEWESPYLPLWENEVKVLSINYSPIVTMWFGAFIFPVKSTIRT